MKRILLIFLSLCLLSLPAPVQGGVRFSPKKITAAVKTNISRAIEREKISCVLHKRVKTSFKRARKTQQSLPACTASILGEPARRVRRAKDMPQARVYTDRPFLSTRQQTADYMLAQHNRLFVQQSQTMRVWAEQLNAHVPQMEEAARHTPQPESSTVWLTRQIPKQTSMLFVGETHEFPEIRTQVQVLLAFLRQQNPEREIMLFTEFLPENFRWTKQTDIACLDYPEYAAIWKQAEQEHITTIGLEPTIVMTDYCEIEGIAYDGSTALTSQWAHLEGMRLRNEAWLRTLKAYRAKHPDALFVVYSGAYHSAYYFPFSLATALTQERSFVAAFYPDKKLTMRGGKWVGTEEIVRYKEPLEIITNHIMFQQPTLLFKDPQLAKLAGFDVRLRISVNPKLQD